MKPQFAAFIATSALPYAAHAAGGVFDTLPGKRRFSGRAHRCRRTPDRSRVEFLLAAAQNLRKLAKLMPLEIVPGPA
jgi:hypothetical protein